MKKGRKKKIGKSRYTKKKKKETKGKKSKISPVPSPLCRDK
jgi:hypothetical protein